jgi:hypothetical protein
MVFNSFGFLRQLLFRVFVAMGLGLLAVSFFSLSELGHFFSGFFYEGSELAADLRIDVHWFLFGSSMTLFTAGILIYIFIYIVEYRFAEQKQRMSQQLYTTLEEAHLQKLELQYTITLSFITAFAIARTYVILLGADNNPDTQLWIGSYHIHHFFFGTALLIISNWISLFWKKKGTKTLSAVCYGTGLGFFTDEIGLLLTEGNYWAKQTYIFGTLFILILLSLLLHTYIKVHRQRLQQQT